MELLVFDTDSFDPASRHAAFSRTLVNLRVEPVGDPLAFNARVTALHIAPVLLYRNIFSPIRYVREASLVASDAHEHFSLTLLQDGEALGYVGSVPIRCRAGDALLIDHGEAMDISVSVAATTLVALLPRRFLQETLPGLRGSHIIQTSPALRLARDSIESCLSQASEIRPVAAENYARSLREMIAAALLEAHDVIPVRATASASLLRRIVDYIDSHLEMPLTTAGIATTLGVSRSALYRASLPVGGVRRLHRRRRLHAVSRMLRDRAETRPVSTIAIACGYRDMAQFSRDFRRVYGMTPRIARSGRDVVEPPDLTLEGRMRDMLLRLSADETYGPPLGRSQ